MPQIPTRPVSMAVQDWRAAFAVTQPAHEQISKSLWERLTYTSAATVRLDFFTRVPATRFAGNLVLAGQLPQNNHFLAMAIRVMPFPNVTETAEAAPAAGTADGALQDQVALTRDGIASFRVGDKDYGEWPIYMLPGGGGPWGVMQMTGGAVGATAQFQHGTNGAPDPRSVYSLPVPVAIPPLFNFSVTLEWPAAATLVNGDTAMFVMLDGLVARPVQ